MGKKNKIKKAREEKERRKKKKIEEISVLSDEERGGCDFQEEGSFTFDPCRIAGGECSKPSPCL